MQRTYDLVDWQYETWFAAPKNLQDAWEVTLLPAVERKWDVTGTSGRRGRCSRIGGPVVVYISLVDSSDQRNISSLHGSKGDENGSREALVVGF